MNLSPFGRGFSRVTPYLLLSIPFILYVVFGVGPSLFTFLYSFTDYTGLIGSKWNFVGLQNYERFFNGSNADENYRSVWLSIKYAALVTFFQLSIALFVALILNRKLKGDMFYRATFFFPVILGVTVAGLIWTLMVHPISGPAQVVQEFLGTSSKFFTDYDQALYWIVLVQVWIYMGYSMIIFLAGLQSIPKDLYEAAYIDGSTNWQAFKNVTFPMIAPALTVNVILSLIGSLGTFDIILVLSDGKYFTNTLAVRVFDQGFRNTTLDVGIASVYAMIQFVLVFIVVGFAQHYLRKREVEL